MCGARVDAGGTFSVEFKQTNPGRLFWAGLLVLAASASASAQVKVITEGDTWRYFKGTEQPPAEWNTIEFDDSSWFEGETPMGYSTDLPYRTILDDMIQVAGGSPGYLSVFARKTFNVSLAEVKALTFLIKIDDGFVAYLNGVEVARRFRYRDGSGEIGVVGSVTLPFCGSCHRARISADGKLFTCLFATAGHDLRALLRALVARGVNRTTVRARNDIAQLFRWAERRQPWRGLMSEGNPALLIEIEKIVPTDYDLSGERERVLTEAEVVLNQKKNMRAALVRTNWKIYGTDGAAGLLGIKPTTLIERMKKFGLKKPV